LRLCKDCETDYRIEEIKRWTQEERDQNELYATKLGVGRAIRRQAKGEDWFKTGEQMKKAKLALKEEREMDAQVQVNQMVVGDPTADGAVSMASSVSSMSRGERRTWVLRKSKSLASALINCVLKDDTMWDAIAAAGERMQVTADAVEKMEQVEAELASSVGVSRALDEEWTRCAATVVDQTTYRTAGEHDAADQGVFLKALDFADEVGPDIRMYNVCTQPCETHGKCGLAFPSKLWWQKGKRKQVRTPAKRPVDDVVAVLEFQVPL